MIYISFRGKAPGWKAVLRGKACGGWRKRVYGRLGKKVRISYLHTECFGMGGESGRTKDHPERKRGPGAGSDRSSHTAVSEQTQTDG